MFTYTSREERTMKLKKWQIVLIVIVAIGVIGAVFGSGGEDEPKADNQKSEEKTKKKEFGVGETVKVEDINITVNSTRVDEGMIASDDGTVYFVMDITLENTSDKSYSSSSMMCFTLKDTDGREQDLTVGAKLNGSMDTEVPAGEKASGEIAFKTAPEGKLVLTYKPGFGDSVKINVR